MLTKAITIFETVTTKPKGKTSKATKVATEMGAVETKSAGSVVKSHRHAHALSTNGYNFLSSHLLSYISYFCWLIEVAGYHLFKDKFWKKSVDSETTSEEGIDFTLFIYCRVIFWK